MNSISKHFHTFQTYLERIYIPKDDFFQTWPIFTFLPNGIKHEIFLFSRQILEWIKLRIKAKVSEISIWVKSKNPNVSGLTKKRRKSIVIFPIINEVWTFFWSDRIFFQDLKYARLRFCIRSNEKIW